MGFDTQNFGLGLLAGWASAYGIYRARHILRGAARTAGEGAASAQNSALRSADSRYINDLIARCERAHLAGVHVPLTDVLIEPRFLPPTPFAAPQDDVVSQDAFELVPRIHDLPYLHAPYNLETLSIDDLSTGHQALALLGAPGSGRTTALLTIALHSLGKAQFEAAPDAIQQRLDAEEAGLSDKERAVRIKERVMIEQRAKERLANERAKQFDVEDDEETANLVPLFKRLMPVYVHFADLQFSQGEFGAEVDPAEPLVRAVQFGVRRVTASTIPRNLYNRFNRGQVLLLLDGFDELSEDQQVSAQAWLSAFLSQYRHNFVIAAGPVAGYGALTRVGLMPVFMRPWSDLDARRAAERWASAWPQIAAHGKRRRSNAPPEEPIIQRAATNCRALTPFEITLKIWATYAEDSEAAGVEGWLRALLARQLPADHPLGVILPQLAQIAALQIDEGVVTAARLQALALAGVEADAAAQAALEQETDAGKSRKKPAPTDSETTSAQGRLLGVLRRAGLLVRHKNDRYSFEHSSLAAYLASLTLADAPRDLLAERMRSANWKTAWNFAALHMPMDGFADARLHGPADVLYTHVMEAARWLAYAPADVGWRGPILKYLGNLLIAPNQFPLVRERAVAALVGARDKNVLLIFRRAVRNANPTVRRLACLGLGALGDDEGVRDLVPLLQQDPDPRAQLAAGIALGAIGSEPAIEAMILAFTAGSEQLRQAMAEAFAALPADGHPILYEAIADSDMMLRRAAVFGLRRIKATWAVIAIYRAFLEDEQWYVRSAAQQAFNDLQYGRPVSATLAYPSADSIAWLREWTASRGENLPAGEGANQMLLKALQEGDPEVRALAARCLGQLGQVPMIRALYSALRDRQDDVRAAAQAGLADLQYLIGEPLPIPA